MHTADMNPDTYFKDVCQQLLKFGKETAGRTKTNRVRLFGGFKFQYDLSNGKMQAFTLRKNNPALPIGETLAFLMGADSVHELSMLHPALKLWDQWASDDGKLGGVYGEAFCSQYPGIVKRLISEPLSTHHRMTTLIPAKFPIPGLSYHDNVEGGRFTMMPCLHSYHFLSDGETLHLHATQASADVPIGVFPHDCYQVQFMLLLTAYLTGLKPGTVSHYTHDTHFYTNQREAIVEMLDRPSLYQEIGVQFDEQNMKLDFLTPANLWLAKDWVQTSAFDTHPAIAVKVDS